MLVNKYLFILETSSRMSRGNQGERHLLLPRKTAGYIDGASAPARPHHGCCIPERPCRPERSEGSRFLPAAATVVVRAKTKIPHFARDDTAVWFTICLKTD